MLKRLEDIGHIIQNAILFNPRNWSKEGRDFSVGPSPVEVVKRLFALLAARKVDYVLVGASPYCTTSKDATRKIWICCWL